jgi:hypothetical protein
MNQTKQSTRRSLMRFYAPSALLLLLLAFGASPERAQGQWTTGTDISNTNTGNVGIGTASPGATLHVRSSGGTSPFSGAQTFWVDTTGTNKQALIGFRDSATLQWFMGSRNGVDAPNNRFGIFNANGASEVLSITQGGNVGIGTTNPANLLHVAGAGDVAKFSTTGSGFLYINQATAGNNYLQLAFQVAGLDKWHVGIAPTTNDFSFWNSATSQTAFTLKQSNGNVGIGTTNPLARLQINGIAGVDGGAKYIIQAIDETPMGAGVGGGIAFTGNYLGANLANFSGIQGIKENGIDGNYNGAMIFTTRVTGGAMTERVRISSAGNVGIGINAPAYKLDVDGEINATGLRINGTPIGTGGGGGSSQWTTSGANVYYNTGNIGIGTTSPNTAKLVVSGSAGAEGLDLASTDQYANLRVIRNSLSGFDKDLYLQYQAGAASKIRFYSNNAESMTLADGNLGIGTTTPNGKLDVRGTSGAPNFATGLSGILRVGAANEHLEFGYVAGSRNWIQSFGAVPLYINEGGNNVILNSGGGNVGIGTTNPTAKLHVVGDIEVTGNINAKYQDVAEWVESSQKLEAGTVVALDTEKPNQVLASSEAYDTKVAGVVSAQPGISLGERGEGKVLVATTGRVKVKVDASRAPIKIGDLLVTSDVAGLAMKSEPVSIGGRRMHAPGTLIGKALEPLAKGTGEILVLLSLQ